MHNIQYPQVLKDSFINCKKIWVCYVTEKCTIKPTSKWSDVVNELGGAVGEPVVLNRASSTNTTNPFGSTNCYGIRNIIFEVGFKLFFLRRGCFMNRKKLRFPLLNDLPLDWTLDSVYVFTYYVYVFMYV